MTRAADITIAVLLTLIATAVLAWLLTPAWTITT